MNRFYNVLCRESKEGGVVFREFVHTVSQDTPNEYMTIRWLPSYKNPMRPTIGAQMVISEISAEEFAKFVLLHNGTERDIPQPPEETPEETPEEPPEGKKPKVGKHLQ